MSVKRNGILSYCDSFCNFDSDFKSLHSSITHKKVSKMILKQKGAPVKLLKENRPVAKEECVIVMPRVDTETNFSEDASVNDEYV